MAVVEKTKSKHTTRKRPGFKFLANIDFFWGGGGANFFWEVRPNLPQTEMMWYCDKEEIRLKKKKSSIAWEREKKRKINQINVHLFFSRKDIQGNRIYNSTRKNKGNTLTNIKPQNEKNNNTSLKINKKKRRDSVHNPWFFYLWMIWWGSTFGQSDRGSTNRAYFLLFFYTKCSFGTVKNIKQAFTFPR